MTDLATDFDIARQFLGEPYASGDQFAIYCGDCRQLMRRLPHGMCHLTVTSPPYNIGKEYETPLAMADYIAWCVEWMREVYRITHRTGAFWLNVGYAPLPGRAKALPLAYLLWDKSPFHLVQEVVWNYGAGVAAKTSLSPRNEKLLWYVKDPDNYTFNLDAIRDPEVKYPNQKKNGKLRCNTLGKNPSDVWQIAKVTSGQDRTSPERTPHPAQFPLDLIHRIVLGFSHPKELVIDPFMGSGTVALSCIEHRRKFIGFEIREEYCHIAALRLEKYFADRDARLFVS